MLADRSLEYAAALIIIPEPSGPFEQVFVRHRDRRLTHENVLVRHPLP